jgi:hypothetical protein
MIGGYIGLGIGDTGKPAQAGANSNLMPLLYVDPDQFFGGQINLAIYQISLFTDPDQFFVPEVVSNTQIIRQDALFVDPDQFFVPNMRYNQFIIGNLFLNPAFVFEHDLDSLTFIPPYTYPIGRSFHSDYGFRGNKMLTKRRYVIGRR